MGSPMHRRWLVWGLTGSVGVTVLGACAALSGLDQYAGDGCTSCTTFRGDTGLSEQPPPPPPDDGSNDGPDLVTTDDGTLDAPEDTPSEPHYSDVVEGTRDAEAGGPPLDAGGESGTTRDAEAGPPLDAGHDSAVDAPPDVAADAPPDVASCNAASCNGCCTAAGLCAAGGLGNACGKAGAACQSCSSGTVCSGGSCALPPADAGDSGPSGCSSTTCSNLCVPWFVQCCKVDQSCGCALFLPPGPCQ
jgi:hypothetical protein